MIGKLLDAVKGYKTYILSAIGVLVAIAGHFWGPINIAGTTIPQLSTDDMWKIIWESGIFSAIRNSIGGTSK